MSISDWSSDVCSSDLQRRAQHHQQHGAAGGGLAQRLLGFQLAALVGRGAVRIGLGDGRADRAEEDEAADARLRSEEHTSELQSLMRISYAVFCLKKKKYKKIITRQHNTNVDRHIPI